MHPQEYLPMDCFHHAAGRLKALEKREADLDGFLEVLNELMRHGFRLREEVYVEAVREARRIAAEA
jgi:hypothetical protein